MCAQAAYPLRFQFNTEQTRAVRRTLQSVLLSSRMEDERRRFTVETTLKICFPAHAFQDKIAVRHIMGMERHKSAGGVGMFFHDKTGDISASDETWGKTSG